MTSPRSAPWTPFLTIRGDELRVRTTPTGDWVEALIPSGIALNDPGGVNRPCLAQGRLANLLALQSDAPASEISTLRLADVVLQDRAEADWVLDQAVRQLDGLRHYLLIITERDYPKINFEATAETARRAFFCAHSSAAITALINHGAMRGPKHVARASTMR